MKKTNFLGRFLKWRIRHIRHKHFVLFLSLVIGLLGGLSAVLLKNTVHYTSLFLTKGFDEEYINFLYLAYPIFGIIATVLFLRFIAKDSISHGISKILYAISRKNSKIKSHNTYSSIVSASLTVGAGGSAGLEAPIVLTGASIGSNIARIMHLDSKTTRLLLACGVAGAMAGIFKAPIATVIFVLEVLMLDLSMSYMIPLLLSSVTGATVAKLLLGDNVLFYFTIKDSFEYASIPFYVVLGVIAGFVSVYFTRTISRTEKILFSINKSYKRWLIGGISLGVLIFVFPPLYGEGYEAMKAILGDSPQDLTNSSIFFSIKDNSFL